MIQVRGVSKDFLLPHLRQQTLKGHVINLFRRGKTIEVQHALADIEFDVGQGEFFGVVGRNGSGKSTLLKILAGIYKPTRGNVTVGGRLVPFIELGVGFNPELTGRENVYLNGALLGFSRNEVDEIYDDIVAFAELEQFMDQKLKNYSSGMQVRIAFSVATRARADVLLIDEVLAVGDAAFQRKCFDHFRALKKSGATIVFVTHDMSAVREFCDRAILIEESRVLAMGRADEVATQYSMLFAANVSSARSGQPDAAARRWGEGHVRYSRIDVPEVLTGFRELVVELEAVAEQDVDGAIYGLIVADATGTTIMGTDSSTRSQQSGGLKAGERANVRWAVPNVFSDGSYSIGLTITDPQGYSMYDSWPGAASFTVVKEEKSPYFITPEASFRVARVED
jgi:ABC-2 type transport system ATP-binding protein